MKLTAKLVEQLEQRLRSGSYLDVAARSLGVDPVELEARMRTDRKLRERLETARASAEFANVTLIQRSARDGNWVAAAWLLERLHPERYARPSQRGEEKPQPELPVSSALDDLERRRAQRRAGKP